MNYESVSRRTFIKKGSIAVAAGLRTLSSVNLIAIPGNQPPSKTNNDIVSIVTGLNREIFKDPDKLDEVIPDLARLAAKKIQAAHSYLDTNALLEKQLYLNEADFLSELDRASSCNDASFIDPAGIVLNSDTAYINTDRIKLPYRIVVNSHAATSAVALLGHELIHQATREAPLIPPIVITDEDRIYLARARRGISYIVDRDQSFQKDERTCVGFQYNHLQEGLTEHEMSIHMYQMGFVTYGPSYPDQVRAYHYHIILPLMNADFLTLSDLSLKADPFAYFSLIGRRLKALPPSHVHPSVHSLFEEPDDQAGEKYAIGVVPRFLNQLSNNQKPF